MFKRLSPKQNVDLESNVTYEEIKKAIWDCGTNKYPGPDGFTFDFFRKYWKTIDQDVVNAALRLLHYYGKWDKANFITIVQVLKCFFLASGLKINIHKSKLMGVGISQEEVHSTAILIRCSTFTTPFTYLGVKVGAYTSRSNYWDEVIAKISARLLKWKIKTLFIGGRLTLIKSVLTSLPLYHMSINKAHMGVLNRMESLRGLGVSSFFALNRALLFKWIWRFMSHGTSLWSHFIKALYGDRGSLDNPGYTSRRSLWYNIIREFETLSLKGINLQSHMKKKVGNGVHTLFWEDPWLNDLPLMNVFPRLYALECDKKVTVAMKLTNCYLIDSFLRPPRGGIEEDQLGLLVDKLAPVILTNSNDSSAGESSSHLFFSCNMARLLLRKVARWWELDLTELNSYEDWLN
ncbi:hypothetical protein Tco_0895746 [Tanacetum coccineum]|uniref:RNA-directed DNA polymerase, eukaryota, reverse transcriptase zinc-binding domain protein n=1 Tax=Tanacetum coccineum TaxID=301880 RepID=A0ABQ5CLP7_9ASTR